MKMRDVVSFVAFGAILVFVFSYFGSLGLRVQPPSDRTTVSMDIPDINGLVAGSRVTLRGVPVGEVSNVSTSTQSATVDFYVEGRYQIPVDTEVRLENLSALGESYIDLRPRGVDGPILRDGQRIATESVIQPASISELATSVVRVLHQLDPGALQRIIDEANTALPDPAMALPNISRASLMLKNAVADLHGRGRVLLDNFQALLQNAEWVGPTLQGLTPTSAAIGAAIQDVLKNFLIELRRGEPQNLTNLNNLVARVQRFLDERGPDLKVIGEAFQPKLNAVAGALMNFDTGQLLDNALAAVPADGTITLRVVP
jgi:phospholipid/cholesterol/gamma-HCH transport system substrate-binding protein